MNTPSDDILEKIRRVMRLVERAGTDGEKSAAEAAAERLAKKHGINLDEIRSSVAAADVNVYIVDDDCEYSNITQELACITYLFRKHFGVIPIQHRHGRKARIRWVGTRINIEIAKHVFRIILRECNKAWREARLARKYATMLVNDKTGYVDPRRQRQLVALTNINHKAFLDGWFWTIDDKLTKNPLRNDISQLEAEKRATEEAIKKMQEADQLKTVDTQMSNLDKMSMCIGADAASRIHLNRTCGDRPVERTMIG